MYGEKYWQERREIHDRYYGDPGFDGNEQYELNAEIHTCGLVWKTYRERAINLGAFLHTTGDRAGVFRWQQRHAKHRSTFTVNPLRNHRLTGEQDASSWEIRINQDNTNANITVGSREPGQRTFNKIASVQRLDLAFACAHEYIRRMSPHILRENNAPGAQDRAA